MKKMNTLNWSNMDYSSLVLNYNEASKAYYKESAPIMNDSDFDELVAEIRRRRQADSTLPSPFSAPQDDHVEGFAKVQRANPMLSLRDIYTREEVEKWWNGIGNLPVSVEAKLDGLSLSIEYKHGRLFRATTRGTGYEGDDVTAQVMNIQNVPHTFLLPCDFEVRGEVVMPLSSFEKWNSEHPDKPLSNPRNGASGALKSYDTRAVVDKGLRFCAYYSLCETHGTTHSRRLHFMEEVGFDTLPHEVYVATTLDDIMWAIENVEQLKQSLDVCIDGVVLKVNDPYEWEKLSYSEKFYNWAIAYKFRSEVYRSTLTDVEWSVAESGRVTPVAIYEAVNMYGTNCTRATMNNPQWMEKNLPGIAVGDTLLLTKGGEIIPKIIGFEKKEGNTNAPIVPPASINGVPTKRDGAYLRRVPKAELSPIAKQFCDLKKKHTDRILLFQCGDFYETYGEDAVVAAKVLGITLTVSHKELWKDGTPLKMAGFPYHALDTYLPKLIRSGHFVAICDQIEAPKEVVASRNEEPKEKPVVESGSSLSGKRILVSGNFGTPQIRKDIERAVIAHGGQLANGVTLTVDYYVLPDDIEEWKHKAGSKWQKIQEYCHQSRIITKDKFYSMLH